MACGDPSGGSSSTKDLPGWLNTSGGSEPNPRPVDAPSGGTPASNPYGSLSNPPKPPTAGSTSQPALGPPGQDFFSQLMGMFSGSGGSPASPPPMQGQSPTSEFGWGQIAANNKFESPNAMQEARQKYFNSGVGPPAAPSVQPAGSSPPGNPGMNFFQALMSILGSGKDQARQY